MGVTVFELLSQNDMNKAALLSSASSGHTCPGLHGGQHSKETEGENGKVGRMKDRDFYSSACQGNPLCLTIQDQDHQAPKR